MKKPSASKKSLSTAKPKPDSLSGLLTEVRQLIQSARRGIASAVDTFQVMTNFEIGRRIVEHEQKGAKRAAYGSELLKELSARLTEEFGRGFSRSNLEYMRKFFLEWQNRLPQISQTASGILPDAPIFQSLTEKSASLEISQTLYGILTPAQNRQAPSGKSPFILSWSHYVVFMTIKDPDERSFYEIESRQADWDVRELKRQKASCLYERLALSRDKADIRRLSKEGQVIVRPEDLLKEPLVLEFLGLEEKSGYSENDLEQAIIDRLEHFLLELGKGFLFEARQKRFTFDEDHYFVDLVFYNRLLRCYVIIDLKLDKLTHQDLGQMQMYVNYYDREVKLPEENPTIGLLLCKSAKKTVVELTLPKDANIHAKELGGAPINESAFMPHGGGFIITARGYDDRQWLLRTDAAFQVLQKVDLNAAHDFITSHIGRPRLFARDGGCYLLGRNWIEKGVMQLALFQFDPETLAITKHTVFDNAGKQSVADGYYAQPYWTENNRRLHIITYKRGTEKNASIVRLDFDWETVR